MTPNENYTYDPTGLKSLIGREKGRPALLIGGGPSGGYWRMLMGAIFIKHKRAPVVITLNGCNLDSELNELADYSVMLECDPPLPDWQWTPQPNTVVLMNWRMSSPFWWGGRSLEAFNAFKGNTDNYKELILAERSNGDYGPRETHIRQVNHGLWYGPWGKVKGIPPLGTSANQMIHLAGILGCTEAHSIGIDLCIKDETRHHWYAEEKYNEEGSRKPHWPVVEYNGLKTFDWWIDSARWLVMLQHLWNTQGFSWYDHSDGLLDRTGAIVQNGGMNGDVDYAFALQDGRWCNLSTGRIE